MAIIPLNKITLYGDTVRKHSVIANLQQLGCVHLTSLVEDSDTTQRIPFSDDTHRALRYLETCPEQRRPVCRSDHFDYEGVVTEVLAVADRERDLEDEREELHSAIATRQPWGDFRMPTLTGFGGLRPWFYVLPLSHRQDFADNIGASVNVRDFAWQEVARDHQNSYIVVFSKEEPERVARESVNLTPESLSQLKKRLEEVEEELDELRYRRNGLTRYRKQLARALDNADDAAAREDAERKTLDREPVFALRGWAPCRSTDEIIEFTRANELACTIEAPSEDDTPPTMLENAEQVAGGEQLVTFYRVPQYRSWDPSLVIYGSFAVFFAMILADAGYGGLLSLVVARYWKRMGQSRDGCRVRNVLATLVALSIGYGMLCGSYFGVSPSSDSILGKMHVLDATSQEVMMPLTILVGVVHLSLANFVMAWTRAGRLSALCSVGWVVVMAGATTLGIGQFGTLAALPAGRVINLGAGLLVVGLLVVFLFASERPLLSLSPKNHLLRVVDGLRELTGVSGLFGDVLSYLRLFALGLSSAKLASTFNALARDAWDNAGIGVIAAIGILILGHTLNLLLGIMSGVVHGLRLNCIEFFKWSLPEEGHLFRAFAKKGETI